jgi:cytidylate kinase
VILDGRDIGTVVFPDANYKFFLIATTEARAMRRFKEMKDKGKNVSLESVKEELIWRDRNDTQREESPLLKAEDAIEIDTTEMTIEGQIGVILGIIRRENASVL